MKTTTQIKLLVTKEQINLIKSTLKKYVVATTATTSKFAAVDKMLKISSKDINIDSPSALRGQIALMCLWI